MTNCLIRNVFSLCDSLNSFHLWPKFVVGFFFVNFYEIKFQECISKRLIIYKCLSAEKIRVFFYYIYFFAVMVEEMEVLDHIDIQRNSIKFIVDKLKKQLALIKTLCITRLYQEHKGFKKNR